MYYYTRDIFTNNFYMYFSTIPDHKVEQCMFDS